MWTFLFLYGLMWWNSLYFCLSLSPTTHTHTHTHTTHTHTHTTHTHTHTHTQWALEKDVLLHKSSFNSHHPTRNLICFWYSLNIYGKNEWKAQWKMFEPPRPYCQQWQSAQMSNLFKGWFWVSRREWSVGRCMLGDQAIFLCKYQAAT